MEIPQRPWQEINIDIIGLLLKSNRKNAIVVIIDRFTKIIRLKTIIINRELQFVSRFMKKFTKTLEITRQLSIAYHPQTDRQTERIN